MDLRFYFSQTRDVYDWLVLLCNFVLAIVGLGGVLVALLTLKKIERQTKAAEDAANAARDNAKAVFDSERAWVLIKSAMHDFVPSSSDNHQYKWVITNAGKTPARIIETQSRYELVDAVDLTSLPSVPQFPTPIFLSGFLLPPGGSAEYLTYLVCSSTSKLVTRLDHSELNEIWSGRNLRVFGYVKYIDAFEEERESRFCEYYVWPSDEGGYVGFRPLLGIPAEYTKHT